MTTITKQINNREYTLKGETEYHHQRGWHFIEGQTTITEDNKPVNEPMKKRSIINKISSNEINA